MYVDGEQSRAEGLPTLAPLSSQRDSLLDLVPNVNAKSKSGEEKEPALRNMDNLLLEAESFLAQNNAEKNKEAVRKLREAHGTGNVTATVTLALLYLAAPDSVS